MTVYTLQMQNQNESLNGMIWERVPKEVYVGRETLELGLYDAVAHFNTGAVTVIRIFQALNSPPGKYTKRVVSFLISYRWMVWNIKTRQAPRREEKSSED